MKNRLGLSSEEFLAEYTYMKIDEKSPYPYAMLKMIDDREKKCPFVTPEGCTIYTDRPANCRYYPIGQGTLKRAIEDKTEEEEFYFFIKEPHCLGYEEDKEWTIESWRQDQGVDLYDEMNREWKNIHLRKSLPGQSESDPRKQRLLYMASYDVDRFRRFIFESGFLDIFELDKETIEEIKEDEIALMKFGFKYIKYMMMLEQTLKIKKDVIKDRDQRGKE
jgi:hypothetical protein